MEPLPCKTPHPAALNAGTATTRPRRARIALPRWGPAPP